jgi:hypothetical protein
MQELKATEVSAINGKSRRVRGKDQCAGVMCIGDKRIVLRNFTKVRGDRDRRVGNQLPVVK